MCCVLFKHTKHLLVSHQRQTVFPQSLKKQKTRKDTRQLNPPCTTFYLIDKNTEYQVAILNMELAATHRLLLLQNPLLKPRVRFSPRPLSLTPNSISAIHHRQLLRMNMSKPISCAASAENNGSTTATTTTATASSIGAGKGKQKSDQIIYIYILYCIGFDFEA